jgi:phosphoenolpyruvate-protein kinase (PTS system EI component)
MQRLRKAVTTAEETLTARGIPFADKVPIGAMIEVPSSALCTDLILEDVDFVSIGSNDLIQYIMAADRDNPRVAHLCEPFTPAIFRILRTVIKACVARGKPVTLCGEMAARPRCVLPLFGMGLRRLSMSPAFVPTVKEFVRAMRGTAAKQAADQVVRMRTVGDIRGYLTRRVQQICPNIALLDTHK